jgi:hypothetical protein
VEEGVEAEEEEEDGGCCSERIAREREEERAAMLPLPTPLLFPASTCPTAWDCSSSPTTNNLFWHSSRANSPTAALPGPASARSSRICK